MTAAARHRWDFTDHETGVYTAGYLAGRDEHAELVQGWLGIVRAALNNPTQAELAAARAYSDEPCSRGRTNLARSGKVNCDCSACTRHIAAWCNTRRTGSPDWPGGPVSWDGTLPGQVAA